MRRIGLLAVLGTLIAAGAAYAAATVNNNYVVAATVKPTKSGTKSNPKPSKVRVSWDVTASPTGVRPVDTRGYRIFLQGIHEQTSDFPGCGTSTLSTNGPSGCRHGSRVGGGSFIIEFGPSGNNDTIYNVKCRWEVSIFNGGAHNFTLYIYRTNYQIYGQPPPCPIPGGHAAIDVSLSESKLGMTESFSLPLKLLHPAAGYDGSLIHANLGIPKRTKKLRGNEVGLLETFFCPANHQREVTITFQREDGVSTKATTLERCKS